MSWTKDKPTKTGWYWHRRSQRHSEHLWEPYYFDAEDDSIEGRAGTWWQYGGGCVEPSGGWWHVIPLPNAGDLSPTARNPETTDS